MSIANYDDLKSAVVDWLDNPDLEDRVGTFVQLAEARINRILDDPEMEVTVVLTAVSAATALPSDLGEIVSISTGDGPLLATGPVEFAGYDTSISGTPRRYAIVDGAISFWPSDATAQITLVYRRGLSNPEEDVNQTNWLLDRAPDIYLYGALLQASVFLVEDERVEMWKSAFDEAIAELRIDGQRRKWGPGPLAPRINRP